MTKILCLHQSNFYVCTPLYPTVSPITHCAPYSLYTLLQPTVRHFYFCILLYHILDLIPPKYRIFTFVSHCALIVPHFYISNPFYIAITNFYFRNPYVPHCYVTFTVCLEGSLQFVMFHLKIYLMRIYTEYNLHKLLQQTQKGTPSSHPF